MLILQACVVTLVSVLILVTRHKKGPVVVVFRCLLYALALATIWLVGQEMLSL